MPVAPLRTFFAITIEGFVYEITYTDDQGAKVDLLLLSLDCMSFCRRGAESPAQLKGGPFVGVRECGLTMYFDPRFNPFNTGSQTSNRPREVTGVGSECWGDRTEAIMALCLTEKDVSQVLANMHDEESQDRMIGETLKAIRRDHPFFIINHEWMKLVK